MVPADDSAETCRALDLNRTSKIKLLQINRIILCRIAAVAMRDKAQERSYEE